MKKQKIKIGDVFNIRAGGRITTVIVRAVVTFQEVDRKYTRYQVNVTGVTPDGTTFATEPRSLPKLRSSAALHPLDWAGASMPNFMRANQFGAPASGGNRDDASEPFAGPPGG